MEGMPCFQHGLKVDPITKQWWCATRSPRRMKSSCLLADAQQWFVSSVSRHSPGAIGW